MCWVGGPNTLPHISSLTSPFPKSSLTSFTPQHTFLHLPLLPLPTSRPTSQHIFLLSPHLPLPSQSVAKLPCDEVSVAKLPRSEVTGNRINSTITVLALFMINLSQYLSVHYGPELLKFIWHERQTTGTA